MRLLRREFRRKNSALEKKALALRQLRPRCFHSREENIFELMDASMSATLAPLILDFLEWLAVSARPYTEVMEIWRTSCPRFPIWEDVLDLGFVIRRSDANTQIMVDLTPSGRTFLESSGRIRHSD
jgi:hypothetical protein